MEENSNLLPNFVITSNDLIEAKYNYSLWEKRVFVYMISTLKRDDTGFKPVKIYIRDLMRFFGTYSNNDYSVIRAIPETISTKPFYVPYQTKDGNKRWSIINVLSVGTQPDIGDRSEGNAYIELKFNADLIPFLLELKEKFTKYDIRNITGLKSVYSIRLYEYLKENEWRKGVFEVTIAELKDMFYMAAKENKGKELYPLYADFKKRVLLKAQEDLLAYCDIKFEFWEKKQGKKVIGIAFDISTNEKAKAAFNSNFQKENSEDTDKQIIKKARQNLFNALFSQAKVLDISQDTLRMLIETNTAEAVQRGFDYTISEHKKGKIKENINGYLIAAVKNGYTNVNFEKQQYKKKAVTERKIKEKVQTEQFKINLDDRAKRINEKIRELTTADSSITETAVQNVIVSKAGQFRLRVLGIENPDIELFRKDEVLREFVKIQIMEAFKSEFEGI